MGFIDSIFPKAVDQSRPIYTFEDVKRFAKPFIHKNSICEAFAFGEIVGSERSNVLSVAFVVSDEVFRSYATMVAARLIGLRYPTVGDRRLARRSAFAAKCGGHKPEYFTGFPERQPFSPESLNIYVLPPGWRMELQIGERARDLKRKLHEEANDDFVAELQETLVVPT